MADARTNDVSSGGAAAVAAPTTDEKEPSAWKLTGHYLRFWLRRRGSSADHVVIWNKLHERATDRVIVSEWARYCALPRNQEWLKTNWNIVRGPWPNVSYRDVQCVRDRECTQFVCGGAADDDSIVFVAMPSREPNGDDFTLEELRDLMTAYRQVLMDRLIDGQCDAAIVLI